MDLSIQAKIEAILFFKGEAISFKKLSELLSVDKEEIKKAISELSSSLENRGLFLVFDEEKVMMTTSPKAGELIEKITKEELSKEIGKAGLETISIILYKSPVTKKMIDYIRGVNSGFILRNLLIRGLIEREERGGRGYSYKPTLELLAFMGLKNVSELPEYENILKELEEFNKREDTLNDETVTGSEEANG